MTLIFGLMLLLKTAACMERFCWFNQSGPCYVALGDKLYLMMVVPDARNNDLMIQKINYNMQEDPVCRLKNDRITKNECNLFNNRPEVSVSNGILIINRVIRADSGFYTLRLVNSDGSETSTDLQVIVEGVERFCWFNQAGPCYAALGDKLNLMMVVLLYSSNYDLKIQKINTQDDPVCKITNDKIKENECDLFKNRRILTVINGILIINPVMRADSGTYRVQLFHSDGTEIPNGDLQVIVEVSSASLVHVLVWCFQMMFLLGLLGGFHIYMRLTSGKKQENEEVRMRGFREGHEHTAED